MITDEGAASDPALVFGVLAVLTVLTVLTVLDGSAGADWALSSILSPRRTTPSSIETLQRCIGRSAGGARTSPDRSENCA
jgi:hypothetical protein